MSHREKAAGLIKIAMNEGATKEERATAALQAAKLIDKYRLLDNPLDTAFDRLKEDETFKASKKVVDTLTDPDLLGSLKTIGKTLSGLGGSVRERRRSRRR